MQTLFLQTLSIAVYTNYIIEIDKRGAKPLIVLLQESASLSIYLWSNFQGSEKQKKKV